LPIFATGRVNEKSHRKLNEIGREALFEPRKHPDRKLWSLFDNRARGLSPRTHGFDAERPARVEVIDF
jgi:hypothetical protein